MDWVHFWEMFLTVLVAVLSSSGLWAFIMSKTNKKSASTRMLIGLGHDRIIYLGMKYLERGDWITEDEYENLIDCLYKPYADIGGNGSAERVVTAVKEDLKLVKSPPKGESEIF